jgi:hypothetical protein
METITLAPMRLTRPAYLRLLVLIWVRKTGWLYGLFILVGCYAVVLGSAGLAVYGLLLFALPLIRLGVLYAWTLRKDNARIYEERHFTINEERIIGTTPSGGRGEIPWSHVVRVLEIDGRYLLYISAGQMLILDKAAFPDAAAEARFRQWLAARPTA